MSVVLIFSVQNQSSRTAKIKESLEQCLRTCKNFSEDGRNDWFSIAPKI